MGAVVGLAVSIAVLVAFVLPALLEGSNPVLVAIVGASVIAFASLYLAHGFGSATNVALLSTLAALALTGVLAPLNWTGDQEGVRWADKAVTMPKGFKEAYAQFVDNGWNALGGYRVQGRGEEAAGRMKREAVALEQAGATLMVLEMVPADLAGEITRMLKVCATIGIGAGKDCDGQVLVLHDMLGVYPGKKGRFVRNFMEGAASIDDAVVAYVKAVKDGSFPAPEHTY